VLALRCDVVTIFINRERVNGKLTGTLDVMCHDQLVYPRIVISLDREHLLVTFRPHNPKLGDPLHVFRIR